MTNHFPQANAHLYGARFLNAEDGPVIHTGKVDWWVLRPDLVFAYLEKPPSWNGDTGKGADWDWSQTGPSPYRAGFDQARLSGMAVSDAVELVTGNHELAAELRNQEALAKAVIQSGVLDANGSRLEWARRAGLGQNDVNDVLPKSAIPAAVDFLRNALSRGESAPQAAAEKAAAPVATARLRVNPEAARRLQSAFGPAAAPAAPLPIPTAQPAATPSPEHAAMSDRAVAGVVVGSSVVVAGLLYLLVRRK